MKQTLINWTAAIGSMAVFFGASVLMDGPSDLDMQRAIEADLIDARAQAARSAPELRRVEADLLAEQRARHTAGQQLAAR